MKSPWQEEKTDGSRKKCYALGHWFRSWRIGESHHHTLDQLSSLKRIWVLEVSFGKNDTHKTKLISNLNFIYHVFPLPNILPEVGFCSVCLFVWNRAPYYFKQEGKGPRGLHLSNPYFWHSQPALRVQTIFFFSLRCQEVRNCGAFLERDKEWLELWKRHPPAMPMLLWAAAASPNSAVLSFCCAIIKQGSHTAFLLKPKFTT